MKERLRKTGDKYVIFDDGFGNLTVGWGITIASHGSTIAIKAGISVSDLVKGAEVDKDIVDSIENEILNNLVQQVKALRIRSY